MRNFACSRRLLPFLLTGCLACCGCKPFGLHKKPDEPPVQDDEEKPKKKASKWDWIDKLRDERALEVERHLGS